MSSHLPCIDTGAAPPFGVLCVHQFNSGTSLEGWGLLSTTRYSHSLSVAEIASFHRLDTVMVRRSEVGRIHTKTPGLTHFPVMTAKYWLDGELNLDECEISLQINILIC